MEIMEHATTQERTAKAHDVGNRASSLIGCDETFSIAVLVNEALFQESRKNEVVTLLGQYGTIKRDWELSPCIYLIPNTPDMAHKLEQDYLDGKLPAVEMMDICSGEVELYGNPSQANPHQY